MIQRVLELTYTAWDLEPFAIDCGYEGPPFIWDEDRRFEMRCELDAAYFHLYLGTGDEWLETGSAELLAAFPTPRHAVDYIMDTFPIVRRKDEQAHGEYRTKRVILAIYDALTEAIRTGQPYQTTLNPPPGPPAEWLDPDQSKHIAPPIRESDWPNHIHRPPVDRRRVDQGRAVLDVLLLLEGWGKPVSVAALEPAFVLMRNEPARNVLLEQTITPSERQRLSGPPNFVAGFEAMCRGMHVNGVIRLVGERAYELAQPERLAEVSDSDRQRAAETIQAIERLGERDQIADAVAEVTDERYEVTL